MFWLECRPVDHKITFTPNEDTVVRFCPMWLLLEGTQLLQKAGYQKLRGSSSFSSLNRIIKCLNFCKTRDIIQAFSQLVRLQSLGEFDFRHLGCNLRFLDYFTDMSTFRIEMMDRRVMKHVQGLHAARHLCSFTFVSHGYMVAAVISG